VFPFLSIHILQILTAKHAETQRFLKRELLSDIPSTLLGGLCGLFLNATAKHSENAGNWGKEWG